MVMDVVHEVEGVAKDVKGVHKDAKGIFAFFGKLFGGKKEEETPKPVEKSKKKKKQPPPEFDENLIYSQVADALTKFFQAYNGLKNYVKEQEELALMWVMKKGKILPSSW